MPQEGADRSSILRFGVFEADLRSGELRRSGVRISLQEQPFRVLLRLLRTPGELVTRDELRQELWAGDTFVDFEHGLNVAIKRLRDAIGDSAETPRFIETLPRRGYRFIAPVSTSGEPATPSSFSWISVVAVLALALALVATARFVRHPDTPRPDAPRILISDITNRTGDDVFDGTVRQALTVALDQSPAFVIVSRERLRDVLRQMTVQDAPVVGQVALEACERAGANITVGGSLAAIGPRYVVTLEAVECASRETLATEQVVTDGRERVLDAVGGAASGLRARLGEAAAVRVRFDRPLRQATTSSLDALKAFDLAEETRQLSGDFAAEPLYLHAIERDPGFAMAHARLSAIYANSARVNAMLAETRRAYAGRAQLTERERLYVDLRYCAAGLSGREPDCLLDVPELWKREYPSDWSARQTIAFWKIQRWGDFEAALPDATEALRLNPDHFLAYLTLASTYQALGRFDEARRVLDGATARRVDAAVLHDLRFAVAFAQHDDRAVDAEREWFSHQPEAAIFRFDDAAAAAFEGRMGDARATRGDGTAAGPRYAPLTASAATAAAMIEAAAGVTGATAGAQAPDLDGAAAAAVLAGRAGEAGRLLQECRCDSRPAVEPIRVLLAVQRGDRKAVAELSPPSPTQLALKYGFLPVYLRGLAYLRAADATRAAAEFQRIIDRPGVDPLSALYPLAHVQQGRAFAMAGDADRARGAYERFFEVWKHADPDVPILIDARREYGKLR